MAQPVPPSNPRRMPAESPRPRGMSFNNNGKGDRAQSTYEKRKAFDKKLQKANKSEHVRSNFSLRDPSDIEFAYSALNMDELLESEKVFMTILQDDQENSDARNILKKIRSSISSFHVRMSKSDFMSSDTIRQMQFVDKKRNTTASSSSFLDGMMPEYDLSGKLLLIYICNFHVLSYLLFIYTCKLHWNP